MRCRSCIRMVLVLGTLVWTTPSPIRADDAPAFRLTARTRVPAADGKVKVAQQDLTWEARQTAVIVCDMWDLHHCLNATERVGELAPRMNQLLEKARARGAFIIHAPSSCMETYKDHPARKRALAAPKAANLPKDISAWCHKIPAEEKLTYPIDQSDGGCDSDPVKEAAWHVKLKEMGRNPGAPWKAQTAVLKIHDEDAVSDSGVEIWDLLQQRGVKNVMLVGVHTNMCVLGRPFGLRQMVKNGMNVVLVRDMTDTMYNPARWPHVSHFEGTARIVAYIEQVVCPTVTSDQLIGGQPFHFKGDASKAGTGKVPAVQP